LLWEEGRKRKGEEEGMMTGFGDIKNGRRK